MTSVPVDPIFDVMGDSPTMIPPHEVLIVQLFEDLTQELLSLLTENFVDIMYDVSEDRMRPSNESLLFCGGVEYQYEPSLGEKDSWGSEACGELLKDVRSGLVVAIASTEPTYWMSRRYRLVREIKMRCNDIVFREILYD